MAVRCPFARVHFYNNSPINNYDDSPFFISTIDDIKTLDTCYSKFTHLFLDLLGQGAALPVTGGGNTITYFSSPITIFRQAVHHVLTIVFPLKEAVSLL